MSWFPRIAWEFVKSRRLSVSSVVWFDEVSAAVFVATYKSSGCTTWMDQESYPWQSKAENCRKGRRGKMFGLARPRRKFATIWWLNFQTKRWQVARKDGRKGSWKVGALTLTPPKFNSLPLKNGDLEDEFPLGYLPIFRGELLNFRGVVSLFLLGGSAVWIGVNPWVRLWDNLLSFNLPAIFSRGDWRFW